MDSSIRLFNAALFFRDKKGLSKRVSIFSWARIESTLDLAAEINLVSAERGIVPERPSKSWVLQAASSCEITGPFQFRFRLSYCLADRRLPPVQLGPHQLP
jgi:hypothetical protein